ncbi:hypothetical protein GCM10018782_37470 [Streptomyces griseoaurantiacus]|nr:hypothetical protein GCM10018782_37470 [Streptomyces griseoaurantiacus]
MASQGPAAAGPEEEGPQTAAGRGPESPDPVGVLVRLPVRQAANRLAE